MKAMPRASAPADQGAAMAVDRESLPPEPQSDWAMGGLVFAASMMILIGVFQILGGLVAIIDDEWFVVTPNYTYDLDVTAWGWIHLILGIVLVIGGAALLQRKVWAGALAVALAMLSAIANFFLIPYYPFWAILIIALDVFVIWAITRPGVLLR
jgi:hypothetical protein